MLGISDVVLFGIKSGLKLVREGRQAFIEETVSKELVIPMPDVDLSFDRTSAHRFFKTPDGQFLIEKHPDLKVLFEKVKKRQELNGSEDQKYIDAAQKFQRLLEIERLEVPSEHVKNGLSADVLKSIATVQQFSRVHNRESASSFQRVLGSLIEIGVDTFSKFPNIIDTESAAGRAVSGFLNSIDGLNFKSDRVDILARSLFISVVETIGENPDLLNADEKTELLIQSVSSGLIKDLSSRVDNLEGNFIERQDVERWGNLVLRSVLGNVGETILSNPKSLGIDDPAQQAIISSVGTAVLAAILDEDKVNLRALFSKQGLDQVVKASLITVAEFPELVGTNGEGIKNIITQVGQGLANNEYIIKRDMLPEVLRLVIEKTAQNAEFLWPNAADAKDKHLLVTASIEFLIQFSTMPESGKNWRPTFSKAQLTGVLDVILEETIQNPSWAANLNVDDQTVIGQVTRITLNVLQDVPADQLNLDTGLQILRSVIEAVSTRLDFLDIIKVAGQNRPALAAALKAIFGAILSKDVDPKVLWVMARGEVLSKIVETSLGVLAQTGITEKTIAMVVNVINESREKLKDKGRWVLKEVLEEIKNIALKKIPVPDPATN